MGRRQRQANLTAFLIGLAATGIVVTVYLFGGLDWIELKTLDLRFRYANSMPEDTRIVCIDIDDDSLQTVGRWPWPRDIQGGLLAILHEAGLNTLLYDVELTEPEPVRSLAPRHADITVDPLSLADTITVAYPDHELHLSIADLGSVYLAFHYESASPPSPEAGGLPAQVRRWLDAEPQRWHTAPNLILDQLFRKVVGGDERRREELIVALRDVLSFEATLRDPILPLERVSDVARPAPSLSPVYYPHARAAERCGFVVFEPDDDGVMRHTQLLIQHDGRVLPQLAFAVAFDKLHLTADRVSATPGRLTLRIPGPDELLTVQLDARGRTLVPWVAKRDWTKQFGEHVPIDAVWQVYDRRLSIRFNAELALDLLNQLIKEGHAARWQQFHDDLQRKLELDSEYLAARYAGDQEMTAQIAEWLSQYRDVLAEEEVALRSWLDAEIQQILGSDGPPPGQSEYLTTLKTLARAFAANDAHRKEIDRTLARLRPRVAGKIGVLGYTATALADMTPIPTHKRAPGVVAHANLLNGMLTGRMVGWASLGLNAFLAAAGGILASLLSVYRSPRRAGLGVAILLVMFVGVAGWFAFYGWTYWVGLTPTVGTLLASYFAIGLYRYVFLDRERRQLTTALSQYTSATLARQMAENPELCRRAETREVTTMFTDFRGFTPISERIGAERTQRVLNLCLGRCSEIMLSQEAMINKFIGDGIFAFWNPVIFPQADHARRACHTAVDLLTGLQELAEEQRRQDGDEVFGELFLRIGVATGKAVVGPCGSEQKYDYTCIGDTVNVAARLESANKFYGTRILVSDATHAQVGGEFEFRPLGGVQVKGKRQAVPIYELLGRSGQVPDDLREYAHDFRQAVERFQQRQWQAAQQAFEACRRRRPDDLAAQEYFQATAQLAAHPPPDDWSGAIELTEK